ncbi:MAG: undecaprenyl-diphosphate phosphatase [Candidatus Moranbacteria bacterium]|nr:undecaprenyl-diphosphate phosphatase [Candidatus Moranbacteria bacterium]
MGNVIEIIKYILLGIIQGITEILPISSSGHLTLFSHVFRMDLTNLTVFLMITNMGSFLALLFFFRKDIFGLITGTWKFIIRKDEACREDFSYVLKLIIAVIPIGIFGFFFKDYLPNDLLTVGFSLMITSALLYFIYRSRDIQWKQDISFKNALIISAFQMFAVFPGISRSGITMSGGLIQKIELRKVLRFSFLSYIIVSVPVSLLGLYDALTISESINLIGYVAAFIMSFIFSLLAVSWIYRYIKVKNLIYFSIYCFAIGVLAITLHFL